MIHVKILNFYAPFSVMLKEKNQLDIAHNLTCLPKLQSWNMFKNNLKTSSTFHPNFLCFSQMNNIEK